MVNFQFSEKNLAQGKILAGNIKNVIFSEGTYQVEVVEPGQKEPFWPFLQLDDEGTVTDCFCTCQEAEDQGVCVHLAAALLHIYKNETKPLHVRFRYSLWNLLMQIAATRHGYDTSCLKELTEEEGFYALSLHKKRLFVIKPFHKKGALRLREIVENRVLETEETSLKFSNLSAEDITLWREGRPTHALQYELSFWSDLAKWFMQLQEDGDEYTIKTRPSKGALPKEIEVAFKEVTFSMYIAEVNWEELIPALTQVKFSWPIYEYQDMVFDKIVYDFSEKVLRIYAHKLPASEGIIFEKDDKEVVLGEWLFHPATGFYPKEIDPLLKEQIIPTHSVAKMLAKYPRLLEKYLTNATLHSGIHPVSYDLYFDEESKFHICAYLFAKGDLQQKGSFQFGAWVFLETLGFYQLGSLLFQELHKVIPRQELNEFVTKHRVWLSQHEGFQTHLTHIESYLTFEIDAWNCLRFKSTEAAFEEGAGVLDLQEWVYIAGRGFYAKTASRAQQVITPGLVIPKEDISSFIKSHEEDLEPIKDFFSVKQPVEKSGLEVFINPQGRIVVSPRVSFAPGYQHSQVRFFGDYSYVDKEGFSLLPKGGKIPEQYLQEKEIDSEKEEVFLREELPTLRPYIVHTDACLKTPKQLVLKVLKLQREPLQGEWELHLVYVSEYGEVSVQQIWEAIKAKRPWIMTQAGLINLEDPRFAWLRPLSKGHFLQGFALRMSSAEWMRLSLLEHLMPPSDPKSAAIFAEMNALQTQDGFSLEGFTSTLRPYQEMGVKWLWFLYSYGLSGLLCDEMGLGKTHQAMGLLAACFNRPSHESKKFLVVCPTSVVYHWQALLKKFLPALKVRVFYGIQRSLKGFSQKEEILLTSYGTMRSEKELLSDIPFEIAIFDELHIAKNAHSQTHKALKGIKAKMKLGLTGTPIENRLLELHALFDVVLPSYLPAETSYKELFVVPIEKNQDTEKKKLLSKLIHPFTLRRKKEEVLHDLPEKTEEIAYVGLSEEQQKLYKEACANSKQLILQELNQEGEPLPYMHIFALFNVLKQVCDHPALIHKDVDNYQKYDSGKWELFVELLQEARESNQKLVVFSQYLGMLDIIELYLQQQGIGYAQIRGSTRNRAEEMRRFKEDPSCEVFIGSLQAAGVGIDLVSASVVIHYDRWWNPAKENQATDRVHRIGQNRGVQVFKLVSKDTIEEHIHELIEKKLMLLREIISYDDQEQIKHLGREELVQILKKIDTYF